MSSKEPTIEERYSDRQVRQKLLHLKLRIHGIDDLLRISGAGLQKVGLEICSACGESTVAGQPGETTVRVHCR